MLVQTLGRIERVFDRVSVVFVLLGLLVAGATLALSA